LKEVRRPDDADEGPDDMPAHIKAVLMAVSLGLPVRDGKLALRLADRRCGEGRAS
jgi:thiamine phosphate synthase YjbQ (UPF0047 family)